MENEEIRGAFRKKRA